MNLKEFYKFGFVEFFNGADIRPPCLKGAGATKSWLGDIFKENNDISMFFIKVSLRLLLRKIHLPLGKGGNSLFEIVQKTSRRIQICILKQRQQATALRTTI